MAPLLISFGFGDMSSGTPTPLPSTRATRSNTTTRPPDTTPSSNATLPLWSIDPNSTTYTTATRLPHLHLDFGTASASTRPCRCGGGGRLGLHARVGGGPLGLPHRMTDATRCAPRGFSTPRSTTSTPLPSTSATRRTTCTRRTTTNKNTRHPRRFGHFNDATVGHLPLLHTRPRGGTSTFRAAAPRRRLGAEGGSCDAEGSYESGRQGSHEGGFGDAEDGYEDGFSDYGGNGGYCGGHPVDQGDTSKPARKVVGTAMTAATRSASWVATLVAVLSTRAAAMEAMVTKRAGTKAVTRAITKAASVSTRAAILADAVARRVIPKQPRGRLRFATSSSQP
mmetsp:Transcript_129341/g.414610  ORF Transcript_129341/g.414610 Transcript_129341/m.414610 type:complete len:338 (-) Transcript_129341:440-1453(-)